MYRVFQISAITVITTLFCAASLSSQPPDTLWTRTYGDSTTDYGLSVQEVTEEPGGYIIAGQSAPFGSTDYDVYLIKTDQDGEMVWTRTYGGSDVDGGRCVDQTSDGGYIVVGGTRSYGVGGYDIYLIKTDQDGDTVWTRTYGGSDYDYGYCVDQTSDGGYIIVGNTRSYGAGDTDVYLIRTNGVGDTLWARTYGDSGWEEGHSVEETFDYGFIISGITDSYGAGNGDVYLIKTDVNGDSVWTRTYGGSDTDVGWSARQTSDDGFIVAGSSSSFGADYDVYVVKTDEQGISSWIWNYGGGGDDEGWSVQEVPDGGYIITGRTKTYGAGSHDVYVIRTYEDGFPAWQDAYGGTGFDDGWSVQVTSDGGYIVAGYTDSFGAGAFDVYLIKIAGEGAGVSNGDMVRGPSLSLTATPNPAGSEVEFGYRVYRTQAVCIAIYNLVGQKVQQLVYGEVASGWHTISWDCRDFRGSRVSPGIYFCRMQSEGQEVTEKVVIAR
jgi:hypothetical protein